MIVLPPLICIINNNSINRRMYLVRKRSPSAVVAGLLSTRVIIRFHMRDDEQLGLLSVNSSVIHHQFSFVLLRTECHYYYYYFFPRGSPPRTTTLFVLNEKSLSRVIFPSFPPPSSPAQLLSSPSSRSRSRCHHSSSHRLLYCPTSSSPRSDASRTPLARPYCTSRV